MGYSPSVYLKDARKTAEKNGYNPSNLQFSDDTEHKMMMIDEKRKSHYFGRTGYGDFLIYNYLEKQKKVKKGLAKQKQSVFHKSHEKIRGNWKADKYSPNNLALRILW